MKIRYQYFAGQWFDCDKWQYDRMDLELDPFYRRIIQFGKIIEEK